MRDGIQCWKTKFRECMSFVHVNVVLMCKPLLPSKTVKTSWIRRNPIVGHGDLSPPLPSCEAALHVTKYGGHSTPFVGFLALTGREVSSMGRTFTPQTGAIMFGFYSPAVLEPYPSNKNYTLVNLTINNLHFPFNNWHGPLKSCFQRVHLYSAFSFHWGTSDKMTKRNCLESSDCATEITGCQWDRN